MKKYAFFAAAAAAFAVFSFSSCSGEKMTESLPAEAEEGEITVLTAGFSESDEEGTRTVRQSDGKVFWSPGDAISIVRTSINKKFTTSLSEPSAWTTFSGTMPSGTSAFWAVYPYNANTYFNGTFLVTTLPFQQEAVAGSFADNLFLSAAYVKQSTTELTFSHQCGGVKFTVTQPGIKRVTLIPADESVFLAGLIGLYAEATGRKPSIQATGDSEDMSNTIELSAPEGQTLEVGAAYHMVTIPATLTGGFSLLFEKEDGSIGIRTIDKDVVIRAAHFVTLKEADKGVRFRSSYLDYSPGEVRIDGLGGLFAIHVNGTLDYHIDVNTPEWIHAVSEVGDVRIDRCHAFLADRNEEGVERMGMLSICYGENCYPILVTQSALGDLKVYPHHTLGMRFTATWCQYCPTMDETFRKAREAMGDGFEYVCIYDTSGNYGFSGSDALSYQYQISSFPSGIIDGRSDLPNYSSTDYGASVIAALGNETVRYYPTATVLGVESTLSGRELTVKVDVKAQYEEDYKLTVFLCENDIIGNQSHYSQGTIKDFNHSRVTRMSLTGVSGDVFEGPAAGEVKSFRYTATIPSGYEIGNMDVVAFVQRSFGSRPALQDGSYGEWYVDNCRAAALGASAPLEVQ